MLWAVSENLQMTWVRSRDANCLSIPNVVVVPLPPPLVMISGHRAVKIAIWEWASPLSHDRYDSKILRVESGNCVMGNDITDSASAI